jgi:cytochrome c556
MSAFIRRRRYYAAGLLLSTWLAAQAAEPNPADIVKYRQSIMKSQREHMAAATAIIQDKVNFKDQLADHARSLEATTRIIAGLFPEGSEVSDTRALGAVWDNNVEFQKRSRDTSQKSAAFAKTIAAGDTENYSARLNDLLDSCKSCHKDFRKKEEK